MDLDTLNDGQITKRYRRRLVFGIGLLVIFALPVATFSSKAIAQLFNRPSDWIPADMPVRVEFDDFASRFSVTDLVMVGWDGAVLGSPELHTATRLLQPLCVERRADEAGVREAGAEEPAMPAEALNAEAVETIALLQQKLGGLPLNWARSGQDVLERTTSPPVNLDRGVAIKRLMGSLVGPDGEQTCLVLSLTELGLTQRRQVTAAIRKALAQQLSVAPEAIAFAGGPNDGTVIDEASIRSIQTFSPPSAIVAALLCFLCLRSISLTLAITSIAVIGEGLVLTAVYFSGSPMNAVLIVLPPLVFVLTVSSGIHLSNYYLDALAEFPEATRAQAAAIAMRAGTMPSLLAASTTVIGLASLIIVRLEPIRIFGAVAIIGLVTTLGLLLLILPGAMILYHGPRRVTDRELLQGKDSNHSASRITRRFHLLLRKMLEHPVPTIITSCVLILILSSGLWSLNTSVNVPRMFDPSHPLRLQYAWFEQNIGPTIHGEVLLRFPLEAQPNALREQPWQPVPEQVTMETSDAIDRLLLVREAHIALSQQEDVGGVLSAVSFLPAVPKGKGLSATASRSVIRAQLVDPESAVRNLGFISRDDVAEVWRIGFRLPMTTQSDYGSEIEAMGQAVGDALALKFAQGELKGTPNPEIVLTGGVQIAQRAQEILFRDLFTSFLSAFLVVAVVMMFLLRSIVGGLIAMIPNIFPTVGLFGYMGLTGLPLDIGSVMTASVALGIAVDDTIHLLSRFGSRRARGMSRKRAAWGALRQCSLAMVHTTLVCGLSLLVYAPSDFVPTRQFSFLMFGLLGIALIGDLLLLPALMVSGLGNALSRPVLTDPGAELENDKPVDARRLPFIKRQGQVSSNI